jgi:hypothetical protein
MENFAFEQQQVTEREPHLPLISTEEQRFIEDTGGEYTGYIRSKDGRRRYEQFRIARRARYDERRRVVVETFIATEQIDREGEKEMQGPEDAFGFSIMIGELSQSGEEYARPNILFVRPTDFKRNRMTITDLQDLAQKVHAFAADAASSSNHSQLFAAVKNYLRSMGWEQSR